MEITAKHWLIVLGAAFLLHVYAVWSLNMRDNSAQAELFTQYNIDLTTFMPAPKPIEKLKSFVPPPVKKVDPPKPTAKPKVIAKPKVVTPQLQQVVREPEPEVVEQEPVKVTPDMPIQTPRIAKTAPSSKSLAEINLEKARYYQLIVDKLQRLKIYPSRARRRGEQGTVRLTFSLNKNGSLHTYTISKSSGSRTLDQAVEKLIKKAAPFPPVPNALGTDKLELSVPIAFKMR